MASFTREIISSVFRVINRITPTSRYNLYFIPHPNCKKDKYDIINFSSDNVLSFANYLLRHIMDERYTFYIEAFDEGRVELYNSYVKSINNHVKVKFLFGSAGERFKTHRVFKKKELYSYLCFFKSAICFATTPHNSFIKTKKQKIICLSYYIPFKDDYHLLDSNMRKKANMMFDYYITPSDLASRIISVDFGISYNKFLSLGFSRNDNLFSNPNEIKVKTFIDEKTGYKVNKVIIYTPTYRDYELREQNSRRSVIGYEVDNLEELSSVLTKNKAVLILKLHPLQNEEVMKTSLPKGIVLLTPTWDFGLYDIAAISDIMITDYTSAYFDFLLLDKPVIFNFYDKEYYEKSRGFSYDPIECFCAGDIVTDYEDFVNSISRALQGEDLHWEKREWVNEIMNKHHDNHSSERIANFYLEENF